MKNVPILPKPKPGKAESKPLRFSDTLSIKGLTPFSTIDYPGKLAAVLYAEGCQLRCRYCYNSHLWSRKDCESGIKKAELFHFLKERQSFLDAVVFSGGEPLLQSDLPYWINWVRSFGYKIGLHTTGMPEDNFENVLPLCDWVGMDIKAPLHRYQDITRVDVDIRKLLKSIKVLVNSKKDYRLHTVYHPALWDEEDMMLLAFQLRDFGVKHFALKELLTEHCSDENLEKVSPIPTELKQHLTERMTPLFETFEWI